MRVAFWGTPDFGLPTLAALVGSDHEVVAVITNPDRPAGRGRRMAASPVKRAALEAGLVVCQPGRPRGAEFEGRLARVHPDVSVVAAYGQLLTEDVLAIPRFGSINIHASLLPRLRGAAPVNWAILRGHERAGVSIMRMVKALDAGPVFASEGFPLEEDTTAGDLYARLAATGAGLLLETLDALERGEAQETPQDDAAATYAPKLGRDDARLDWSRPAVELDRWIRGCDPWPGAWCEYAGTPVQLFESGLAGRAGGNPPGDAPAGTVLEVDDGDPGELVVATGRGAVRIRGAKPAGSRRMTAGEWARGRGPAAGERLR